MRTDAKLGAQILHLHPETTVLSDVAGQRLQLAHKQLDPAINTPEIGS